ncbi:tRNA (adenosine(37)-N6)-threonylcarbamoyltransferase complex transferase subunit TsaD [Mycoplasma sp. 1654_15]|uniref:tRNA (adenosine(37)-N6)-threonylcarbamoyltransferase complex transferase subunit TsaD n=1 Tax=Mycoplasma sp. 1654_15 TaxID=2725994 RepID=UPI0014497F35|nr:tRNA (adenosine(37)-N6)-threonylcarbamoyltransferase complex transferase subunit TsaD [Mycoplasma sp. 1654_15]QJB71183.1 tRNA (adenosine(37)-N6)-threonylcarbamoyltransferase complex transferase subunit TsaD [Mycoplasma sp. 1654_15]
MKIQNKYFLAIESSHDDACIAVLQGYKVIFMFSISQIDVHQKYGGTIPELASREHTKNLAIILDQLKAVFDISKVDYVFYTKEPGLLGSLQLGYLFAKAISLVINKPILPINHLIGHFWSAFIEEIEEKEENINQLDIKFPVLALLVSGGHSQFFYAKNDTDIQIIGKTQDDALGEIYDKIARRLKLGFPGGPVIDKLNKQNPDLNVEKYFSIPITDNVYDLSFSGIKTQVINRINNLENQGKIVNSAQISVDFQKSIIKYLKMKIDNILKDFKDIKTISLVGGVAANSELRNLILSYKNEGFITKIPPLKYCTDNSAMIGYAGINLLKK